MLWNFIWRMVHRSHVIVARHLILHFVMGAGFQLRKDFAGLRYGFKAERERGN